MKYLLDVNVLLAWGWADHTDHRRTTLKALITHALEREVGHANAPSPAFFSVDADGIPYLPSRGVSVSSHTVHRLLEEDI